MPMDHLLKNFRFVLLKTIPKKNTIAKFWFLRKNIFWRQFPESDQEEKE
jgi:hypothetical protein